MVNAMWTLVRVVSALLWLSCFVHADEQDTHNPLEKINMKGVLNLTGKSEIRMTVNVTEVTTKQQAVRVDWSGMSNPSFDDWVGVLAPADADISVRAPVKYKLASMTLSHILRGEGHLTFLLENHRADMRIAMFRNGFQNPHMVAQTEVIRFPNVNRPSHGRLSLTGDPSEMLVQWTTGTSTEGYVEWGKRPGEYKWKTRSRNLTYTRDEMCGGAAKNEGWMEPGTFHRALLTGLHPDTLYHYRFGSPEDGFSDEFAFRSPPHVGPDATVKVLALADMGQAEVDGSNEQSEMLPSLNTSAFMIRDSHADDYSLVVHHGDISYARGYVSQWDRFHEQMEPLIARLPYMTSIGNHERDWPGSGDRFPSQTDSGGECGVAHERRFLMPSIAQDAPWFSFDHGPIHFVHYSTEHAFQPGSPQHDFISADLAAVDRTLTPWVIVGGHRPFYIDSTNTVVPDGDQPVAADLRDALEDLYLQYHVDVTLQGHHHSYQRTCPAYRGECVDYDADGVARGPVHLVIGNAGAALCLNVHRATPKIFKKIHLWWGYARIHASGTELEFQIISDADGEVLEKFTLKKPQGWGERWHRLRDQAPPPRPLRRPQWWWEAEQITAPPQVAAVAHHEERERLRAAQQRARAERAGVTAGDRLQTISVR